MYEYEQIMTFDQPMNLAGPSTAHQSTPQIKYKKSIKSDNALDLRGPMQVDGSVKSMSSVTMSGDFSVRDRIEADKVKIFGKLKINGTMEVHGDLEVWGALTINGYL
ncbi:hypothetical protein N0V88_005952 [Collariella sp. IMI 366227]|nr:hypothetical protein N0V88_005952 [Collariella sp. IMI 366227]